MGSEADLPSAAVTGLLDEAALNEPAARPSSSGPARGCRGVWTLGCSRHVHFPATFAEDVTGAPIRAQLEAFLGEHRTAIAASLDGLSEGQVRRQLVPSRTTLLGLVKHAVFLEQVWFDEAITCRPRSAIGIPATPHDSFLLDEEDTIASVRQAHERACAASRRATSSLGLDDLLLGNRRGPLPLRWVYLHMLRELAQHCGHADILREQLLDEG